MSAYRLVDPDGQEDWSFDWSSYLQEFGNDTISTSTWLVDPTGGLTFTNLSNTNTTTKAFISGFQKGVVYRVTNRITTSNGRNSDRSVVFRCAER